MSEEKPLKPKGWFSRRHQTADAHRAAVERYKSKSARHKAKLKRQQTASAS